MDMKVRERAAPPEEAWGAIATAHVCHVDQPSLGCWAAGSAALSFHPPRAHGIALGRARRLQGQAFRPHSRR